MPKFRKKPVVIEAVQWKAGPFGGDGRRHGGNESEINRFVSGSVLCWSSEGYPCISTLEGMMRVEPDDWIIKGVKGEFYPCKPDIFAATYDEVTA